MTLVFCFEAVSIESVEQTRDTVSKTAKIGGRFSAGSEIAAIPDHLRSGCVCVCVYVCMSVCVCVCHWYEVYLVLQETLIICPLSFVHAWFQYFIPNTNNICQPLVCACACACVC